MNLNSCLVGTDTELSLKSRRSWLFVLLGVKDLPVCRWFIILISSA